MTRRLYEEDSYIHRFDAQVLSCEPCKEGYAVELDATAFFPEGGGQAADTGILGGVTVTDVQIVDGRTWHYTASPLTVGETVTGEIDWPQRFLRMQKHTGEHIVCGFIHREYGLDNVGFHLGSEDVTLDVNGELTREQLDHIENLANEAIAKNRVVTAAFPSAEELSDMVYRSKKEPDGPVRIVTIEGVDVCACCAPHVRSTGEIGCLKLLDAIRYKGGMRIHMQCGMDAIADYRMRYSQTAAVAAALSVQQTEVAEAVERLLAQKAQLALALRRAGRQLALQRAEAAPISDPTYLILEPLDSDALLETAEALHNRCCGLSLVFSGEEGKGYQYIALGGDDLLSLNGRIREQLSGKGGGNAQMIRGRVDVSAERIADFIARLEK